MCMYMCLYIYMVDGCILSSWSRYNMERSKNIFGKKQMNMVELLIFLTSSLLCKSCGCSIIYVPSGKLP